MISSSEKSTAAIGVLNAACQRRRGADGHEPPHLWDAQSEPARDDRRDARADVHRRPFASERDAARQRRRAAHELPDDRAQRDAAVLDEDRGTRLRNAASARIWKEPDEENARDEGA